MRDKFKDIVADTDGDYEAIAEHYMEIYAGTSLTEDQVWEEMICDSLADMNIFSKSKSRAEAAEVMSTAIPAIQQAVSETKTEATNPGAESEGKASRAPNRGRSEEIETMENNRFSRLRKFRDEIPSVWYAYSYDNFYVYSNYSFTDYKILKKVAITDANSQLITEIERRLNENVNADSRTIAGWIKSFRSRERLNNRNNGNADRGRSAGTADGVDGESRSSKAGYDSSEGNGNSKVIGKASRELDLDYDENIEVDRSRCTGRG